MGSSNIPLYPTYHVLGNLDTASDYIVKTRPEELCARTVGDESHRKRSLERSYTLTQGTACLKKKKKC